MNLLYRNVIIFGGSGYIGRNIIRNILHNHNIKNIFVLDIRKLDLSLKKNNKVNYIFCDVRKPIKIKSNVKFDTIINLSAIHREPGHKKIEYFDTNINGTKNIINFAEKKNIKNIIFTSSIAVYGNQLFKKNEQSKLYPDTPYGISKLISEKLFENWQVKSKDRILTISRPGVVFGKDEMGNMERLKKLTNNIIFIFPGNKEIYKASIYIKELINQLFWVNRKQLKKNFSSYELFNSTTYPVLKFHEIVELIFKIKKTKPIKIYIPYNIILFMSLFLNLIFKIFFKSDLFNLARIKKLKINNFVEPIKLKKMNYKYLFSHKSAFEDWLNN
tara:strand:+ start:146 stop:1135 length:990 start_codon:yes stop_codon:yes gene_type:complete